MMKDYFVYKKFYWLFGVLLFLAACPGGSALVSASHHCAQGKDGDVRCWGFNAYGQLGDGTRKTSRKPVEVSSLSDVVAISNGSNYSCALMQGGTVKCWGSLVKNQPAPVEIPEIERAMHLATGSYQTCVITEQKSVQCFRVREEGSPEEMKELQGATQISLARGFSAANGCARIEDGSALCWGRNGFGQLAQEKKSNEIQKTPKRLPLSSVVQVETSKCYACALLEDGSVQCWGSNDMGELGDGTKKARSLPAPVAGIDDAVEIAVGGAHSCARLRDGRVKCWGFNAGGQAGASNEYIVKTPTTVEGLTDAIELSLGDTHSCALRLDNSLYCWGANHLGQLGDGSKKDRATAKQVNF